MPEVFANRPEFLVPLATERSARCLRARVPCRRPAQQVAVDPATQPELAVKLAAASSMYYFCIGELTDCLAIADKGRALYVEADSALGDWLAGPGRIGDVLPYVPRHLSKALAS